MAGDIQSQGGVVAQRRGRFSSVLPKGLELHYDEEDPDLLTLRSRAALLDAFLKSTLSQMGKEGTAVNVRLIRQNIATLLPLCTSVEAKMCADTIIAECNRVQLEEDLQIKARKLVSEFTEVIKAETNRLVAIGGALTVPQIGGLVNGIMTEALRFMAPDNWNAYNGPDAVKNRARAFIQNVRRNVISTPGFNALDQLQEAANIPMTKSMGLDVPTHSTGRNVLKDD